MCRRVGAGFGALAGIALGVCGLILLFLLLMVAPLAMLGQDSRGIGELGLLCAGSLVGGVGRTVLSIAIYRRSRIGWGTAAASLMLSVLCCGVAGTILRELSGMRPFAGIALAFCVVEAAVGILGINWGSVTEGGESS